MKRTINPTLVTIHTDRKHALVAGTGMGIMATIVAVNRGGSEGTRLQRDW